MTGAKKTTKIVKEIKVDLDKCIGCRACEMACSAFHARPRYSSVNPARSRIRVITDALNDEYVPIRASGYALAECTGRRSYHINGKDYSECSFCGASCPARDIFKEPDSGLPLKCDLCLDEPPLEEPICVQVCKPDALVYVEREVEIDDADEEAVQDEMDVGLGALVDKFGLDKVIEAAARMAASQKA